MYRNTVHVYGKYVNYLMAFFKITANVTLEGPAIKVEVKRHGTG